MTNSYIKVNIFLFIFIAVFSLAATNNDLEFGSILIIFPITNLLGFIGVINGIVGAAESISSIGSLSEAPRFIISSLYMIIYFNIIYYFYRKTKYKNNTKLFLIIYPLVHIVFNICFCLLVAQAHSIWG